MEKSKAHVAIAINKRGSNSWCVMKLVTWMCREGCPGELRQLAPTRDRGWFGHGHLTTYSRRHHVALTLSRFSITSQLQLVEQLANGHRTRAAAGFRAAADLHVPASAMAPKTTSPGTRADADEDADALALADTVVYEQFRRSPHPYLHHGHQIQRQSPDATYRAPRHSQSRPSSDPLGKTMYGNDGRTCRKRASQSPSESGTEADDEGYTLVKALPAPPLRPHKGLRESRTSGTDEWASPLLTPTQIDDEGRKLDEGYFTRTSKTRPKGDSYHSDDEARRAKQKYLQRRRNELVRRTTETALLVGIAILVVRGCDGWVTLLAWHRGQFTPRASTEEG
jgi:hypothetical protein